MPTGFIEVTKKSGWCPVSSACTRAGRQWLAGESSQSALPLTYSRFFLKALHRFVSETMTSYETSAQTVTVGGTEWLSANEHMCRQNDRCTDMRTDDRGEGESECPDKRERERERVKIKRGTDGVIGHQQSERWQWWWQGGAEEKGLKKRWERDGCLGNSDQRAFFSLTLFLSISLSHTQTHKHRYTCSFPPLKSYFSSAEHRFV